MSPSVVTPVAEALFQSASDGLLGGHCPPRYSITRRIQSTSPIPRPPSGAARSLKSRCAWALTSPGRMATLPRSWTSCARASRLPVGMQAGRLHHNRRPKRSARPRRRRSRRRIGAPATGNTYRARKGEAVSCDSPYSVLQGPNAAMRAGYASVSSHFELDTIMTLWPRSIASSSDSSGDFGQGIG